MRTLQNMEANPAGVGWRVLESVLGAPASMGTPRQCDSLSTGNDAAVLCCGWLCGHVREGLLTHRENLDGRLRESERRGACTPWGSCARGTGSGLKSSSPTNSAPLRRMQAQHLRNLGNLDLEQTGATMQHLDETGSGSPPMEYECMRGEASAGSIPVASSTS